MQTAGIDAPGGLRYADRMQAASLISIGAGGFLGACARYLFSAWVVSRLGGSGTIGTMAVNVTGSFLLALFLAWSTRQVGLPPPLRLFVSVGFLGAFTTFSTYAMESISLARDGQLLTAAGHVLGNNLLCLAGVCLGLALASRL